MDKIEEIIFERMRKSYAEKMRELPPPPPGYWYRPECTDARKEGDNYVVDMTLTLEPIVKED